MKHSSKVAFSGIVCALAVMVMLMSRMFPFATYALPAVSGVLLSFVVIEIGIKWAWLAFAGVSILAVFLADPQAAIMFIAFLGYYPIVKSLFEKMKSRLMEWSAKMILFNLTMITTYLIVIRLFGPSDDMGAFGKYAGLVMFVLGNVAFVLCDIGLTRFLSMYIVRFHPKIKRILR